MAWLLTIVGMGDQQLPLAARREKEADNASFETHQSEQT
jgi:hypothetical protein